MSISTSVNKLCGYAHVTPGKCDRAFDQGIHVKLATNLLGAMVGGVLEYASLVTGYRSLLIVIALLYAGAFMLQRSQRPAMLSPA